MYLYRQLQGRQHRVQGRRRLTAFVGIILLFSFLLLMIAFVGSAWVTSAVSSYAAAQYEENIQGLSKALDREVHHLEDLAFQLACTDWVKELMYMQGDKIDPNRVSDYEMYEYRMQMYALLKSNSMLSDIGLIFFEKDKVIGSYGTSDLRFFANSVVRSSVLSLENWRQVGANLTYGRLQAYSSASVSRYNMTRPSTVLIFPLFSSTSTGKTNTAMFAVLPHDNIWDFLLPLLLDGGTGSSNLTLSGQYGDEIYSVGTQPSGSVRSISAQCESTGWSLSTVVPESIISSQANVVRNTLLCIVLALWVISAVLAFLMTNKLFRPLEELMHMVQPEDKTRRFVDEYDSLRQGIDELKRREGQMLRTIDQRQPFVQAACFQALLCRSDLTPEESRHYAALLHMENAAAYWVGLLLPMNAETGQLSTDEIHKTIERCKAPGLRSAGACEGMQVLVMGVEDKHALEEQMVELLDLLPGHYVVLGQMAANVEEWTEAYRTAKIARNYRFVSAGYRILRYEETLAASGRYYLPQSEENRLMQLIRSGDMEKAVECFENLFTINRTQQGATWASVNNFLINIHLDIVNLLEESSALSPSTAAWREDLSLEAGHASLVACIREAAQAFRARLQSTPARMEDVLAYISDHLYDSMLSQTAVADVFGVSASLISRLFSEQLGENFLTYINRRRIESACELFKKNPDLDVRAAAQQVGYDSDVTFRRLFKKYIGMSPSSWRDGLENAGHSMQNDE